MSSSAQPAPIRTHTPAATPAKLEFLDLRAQFAAIRDDVMEAVTRVMESQKFILGEEVRLFEEEIAVRLGARHAVSCASGSDALVLAMMAAEIGPGDEVITTPFTYIATAESIARVGAKPVFVDIDPQSFNIDPDRIEAAITPATRAIVPVHLFGMPAKMEPILSFAKTHRLAVIEDAAQAILSRCDGRYAGTLGTLGCFSFFPSKNLGCAGDGGLVTTEDSALAERLRVLRVHGAKKKYQHEILGMNSRLDALQAAILRVKLRHLGAWTAGRQAVARRYDELLLQAGLAEFLSWPAGAAQQGAEHVYNQFTIRSRKQERLREFLANAGIATEIYYPIPLHLQAAFAYLGHATGDYPEAERASREVLSLPSYPELAPEHQERIVRSIAQFYGAKA